MPNALSPRCRMCGLLESEHHDFDQDDDDDHAEWHAFDPEPESRLDLLMGTVIPARWVAKDLGDGTVRESWLDGEEVKSSIVPASECRWPFDVERKP